MKVFNELIGLFQTIKHHRVILCTFNIYCLCFHILHAAHKGGLWCVFELISKSSARTIINQIKTKDSPFLLKTRFDFHTVIFEDFSMFQELHTLHCECIVMYLKNLLSAPRLLDIQLSSFSSDPSSIQICGFFQLFSLSAQRKARFVSHSCA